MDDLDLSADDCAAALELWLGPGCDGSQFGDREELEEVWARLRDVVMGEYARGGRRPMAWWLLEARALGLKYPGDDCEQSYLFESNVLPADERAELVAHWKLEFERGYALDAKARRKFYRDADIPKPLIRTWSRRQARKLTATKEKPSASARGRYRGPVTALR
jgi:hypothetical protein